MNDMELRSRMTAYVSDQAHTESKQTVFVHDCEPFDFPLKKKLEKLFKPRFGAVEAGANVSDDFVAALLGGAAGVYISMFTLKYRLRSLFFMVTMPVLTILNVYILITCFANNFWIIRDNTLMLSNLYF